MKPVIENSPGTPVTDSPPEQLLHRIDVFRPESPVARWGLTTTANGEWGVYVTVPRDTEVPLPRLELRFEGYPVVYEAEPEQPITVRS